MIKPRQQVMLLTYNQEKYLHKCLDSIVNSSVLPWRVTIFDDFSTDGTRDIIEAYRSASPNLFEVVFNNKNLGIFGNLNQIKKYGKADLIHNMAGDDWFDVNFFEEIERVYVDKKLFLDESNFIIIPSFSYAKENGEIIKIENRSLPTSGKTKIGFSCFLRNRILHRYSGMSSAFFSHHPENIDPKKSLWWDRYYYLAHFIHVGNVYFAPRATSYYRLGAGVGSKATKRDLLISKTSALISFLENHCPSLEESDVEYILHSIYQMQYEYQKINLNKYIRKIISFVSQVYR